MLLIGSLQPSTVRDVYLRGIYLGAAWQGPSGDAAINALVQAQVSRAEALMGIHFRRWRVVTMPPATLVPGTDFDQLGLPIPYVAPAPAQAYYELTLHWHDVQAITQVRLFQGYDGTMAPVFEVLPLAAMTFSSYHETLFIPVTLPLAPAQGQGWAVDYLVGLGALPPEVVEWCAIGAAIQILAMGGAAADVSGGINAGSLSMDGIEEKTSYGGAAQWQGGGLYAGPIRILEGQRLDIDLAKLRFRYQNTLGDTTAIPPDAIRPWQPYEQTPCVPRVPPSS